MVRRCRTSWLHRLLLPWLAVLAFSVCVVAAEDGRVLMQAAKEAYDSGEYQRALTQFTGLVSRYPRSFEGQQAAYYQGRCLEQLGRAGEAVRHYRDFLAAYPDSYLRSTAERRIRELQGGAPAASVPAIQPERSAVVSPAPSTRPAATPVVPAPAVIPAAAPPARQSATPSRDLPANHVVRPGETVSGLCAHYYGNAGYWRELAFHNRLDDPARLMVGQRLEFPQPETLAGLTRAALGHYARPRHSAGDSPVVAKPEEIVTPQESVAETVTVVETPAIASPAAAAVSGLALLAQELHAVATTATDPAVVEEAWIGLARIAAAGGRMEEALQHYRQAVQVRPGSDTWLAAMYQVAALELSARHDVAAAKAALEQLLGALPASGQETMRGSARALLATIAGSPEQLGEHELMGGTAVSPVPAPPTLSLNVVEVAPRVRPARPVAVPAPTRPVNVSGTVPVFGPAGDDGNALLMYDGRVISNQPSPSRPGPVRPGPPLPARSATAPAPVVVTPPIVAPPQVTVPPSTGNSDVSPSFDGFTEEDLQAPEVVQYIPAPDAPPPGQIRPGPPITVTARPPDPVAGVAAAPGTMEPVGAGVTESPAVSAQDLRVGELLREALNLKNRGMYMEADGTYRAALAIDPQNPEALNNLAYLYAELGVRLDEAEEMVRQAMQNDALRVGYYRDTLGWILYKKGDLPQAREELRRAVAYQGTAERYYHLALVYRGLGDHDEARRCLQSARELAGRSPLAAEIAKLLAELGTPPAS